MIFEPTFKAYKPDYSAFYLMQITSFDRWNTKFGGLFCFVYVLLPFLATLFELVYIINIFPFIKKSDEIGEGRVKKSEKIVKILYGWPIALA